MPRQLPFAFDDVNNAVLPVFQEAHPRPKLSGTNWAIRKCLTLPSWGARTKMNLPDPFWMWCPPKTTTEPRIDVPCGTEPLDKSTASKRELRFMSIVSTLKLVQQQGRQGVSRNIWGELFHVTAETHCRRTLNTLVRGWIRIIGNEICHVLFF